MRTVYIGDYLEAELGSGTAFPVFVPDLDNTGLPNKFYLPIVKNGAGAGAPPPANPGNGFYFTHPIHPNQSTITWRMYYSSGDQRVAMRISHGPTTDPYPAPGATQDEVYYLLSDHLGSTTVTVNSDGTVKSRVRYDAWGKTRNSSGTTPTDHKYTGQIEEATVGLYFYNARYYDPSLGRFISPDTIIPQPGSPLAWDRFVYSNNNPITFSDPTGHWPTWFDSAGQFTQGLLFEFARTNNWMGAIVSPGAAETLAPTVGESDAMLAGRIVGDLLTITVGVVEVAGGIGIAGGGAVVGCGTTLCLASAPAIAVGSAVSTLGVGTSLSGAAALGDNFGRAYAIFKENNENPYPNAQGGSSGPYQSPYGYPSDPSKPPAPEFRWRGKGEPGTNQGNWLNLDTGEWFHWDSSHHGVSHYDYSDPNGNRFRIWPDGSMSPK